MSELNIYISMNITTFMIIFLSIAAVFCGFFYTYLAWIPFFTYVGTRKNFNDISTPNKLRFLIPVVLLCASMVLLASDSQGSLGIILVLPLVLISSITITFFYFFLKWKKAANPWDVTLEGHFKKIWPDLADWNIPTAIIERRPILKKNQEKIQNNPGKITSFRFIKKGVALIDLMTVYNSFLDGLGHKLLPPNDDIEEYCQPNCRHAFLTTDGDNLVYIHLVWVLSPDLCQIYSEVVG
jgi:hypothetical protein